MDHDPLQASLCKSILERRFGDVQRVGDAAEALCLVEQPQFAGDLSLVVSEQNLPGLGAPEFVAELHERLPQLPILVLGKDESRNHDGLKFEPQSKMRFVARPFAGDEILQAADELLSERPLKSRPIAN